MVKRSLYREALLNKLSDQEDKFFETFAKDYLVYLGNPRPTQTQIKEINDAEVQLSELLARYHLSFIGNNNPSSKVLEHTIRLLSHIFVKASIVLTASLTTREKEYIELASRGYKLKEIAKFLKIALFTAKSVREVILQKLFCRNITEATAVARKYQLLS